MMRTRSGMHPAYLRGEGSGIRREVVSKRQAERGSCENKSRKRHAVSVLLGTIDTIVTA
jgi:hypothetical protein